MTKKERSRLKLDFLNILFYIDDKETQDEILKKLAACNENIPDNKVKNFVDKILLSTKKSYYDKVEFFLSDIFEKDFTENDRKVVSDLFDEIKPSFEEAKERLWQKIVNLFDWS